MKYLNLKKNEIKELLHIRMKRFISYIVILLIASTSVHILLQLIMKPFLNIFFVVFFAIAYSTYTLYVNWKYLKEIIRKQKRVFHGVLSFKTISFRGKKKKYVFNMDGRIFYVKKKDYEYIEEGDLVNFHVSCYTKHLFLIEKVVGNFYHINNN